MIKKLRIHGDNIVECERTLHMLEDAFNISASAISSAIYCPLYRLANDEIDYTVELLSGHGRWGVDINEELLKNGGILREGADSYITIIEGNKERVLLGIEYCSALPAGNNAWQRNGRALSTVLSGVPYLYFAELGGVELDSATRRIKAPRYPNPIVPFSYLTTTADLQIACIPVYRPHPSITQYIYKQYEDVFGYDVSVELIKNAILEQDFKAELEILAAKTLTLVERLSENRRVKNTLLGDGWRKYLYSQDRANWAVNDTNLIWSKSIAEKVNVPQNIRVLLEKVQDIGCKTIGASEIPVCIVPKEKLQALEIVFYDVYPNENVRFAKDKDLAIVWITGYKPKGDDSRPDRGLCPLTKMVLGDSANLLAIVYGPAKSYTWDKLRKSPKELASTNGLWQSIVNIVDYIFADSVNSQHPYFCPLPKKLHKRCNVVTIKSVDGKLKEYSEHDTDTAIHQILSNSTLTECLCNPPGGDWSGVDYHENGTIYRWTSLPRVSEIGGKRPDHVFQQVRIENQLFISIESKGIGRDLEDNIGINLVAYMKDLFQQIPTSIKNVNAEWRIYEGEKIFKSISAISVGAFIYKNDEELLTHLRRGKLDAVLAFEFEEESTLHILTNCNGKILIDKIKEGQIAIGGFKIKVHRF